MSRGVFGIRGIGISVIAKSSVKNHQIQLSFLIHLQGYLLPGGTEKDSTRERIKEFYNQGFNSARIQQRSKEDSDEQQVYFTR